MWKLYEIIVIISVSGKKIILGTVVALLAIIIGLIASSVGRLSTEEAGIKYDTIQRKLSDSLFLAGLHTGPPGFR